MSAIGEYSEGHMATCDEHGGLCQKLGSIDGKLDGLIEVVKKATDKIESHVDEADRPGGVRERLATVELQINGDKNGKGGLVDQIAVIKQGYWKTALAAGFIGALLGHVTPDFFKILQHFLAAHMGG